MPMLNKLPFQEDLAAIARQLSDLAEKTNPHSDLAEALDRVEAILAPFWNDVEFQTPISEAELDFRTYLQGMKL